MTSMLQIKHILLPIDDSPGTQAAIDHAALLAGALGAAITLLQVVQPANGMVGIVPGASVEGDLADARARSTRRLDEVRDRLVAAGSPDVAVLVIAAISVAPAIVDTAQRGAFELIVMATHGRTGMSRLVLGSIAEEVLRHAPCPVLAIHLPA